MVLSLFSDFSSGISYILYIFSNSLLYPVIILLLLLVLIILVYSGEFITEYTKRKENPKELGKICRDLRKAAESGSYDECETILKNVKNQTQYVTNFAKDISGLVKEGDISSIDRVADSYEEKMLKRLEKTRIISTVGPMLGLMGTLIPLGPALIGLTDGNIEALATNLVVAFATTIVGLFSAGIAYCLSIVRQRWYWKDINNMDYIIDALNPEE